jgi:hypothetical protein
MNNEQLENKSVLLRSRNYNFDTPSKRVQVDVSSPNINQCLAENTTNRDSTQEHTSNHKISPKKSHNFSVKGKGRPSISNI